MKSNQIGKKLNTNEYASSYKLEQNLSEPCDDIHKNTKFIENTRNMIVAEPKQNNNDFFDDGKIFIKDMFETVATFGEKGLETCKIVYNEGKNCLIKTSQNIEDATKEITNEVCNNISQFYEKTKTECSKLIDEFCATDDFLENKISNKTIVFFLLIFLWILFHFFYSFTQYLFEISYWNVFGLLSAILGSIVMGWLGWITFCDISGIITIHKQNDFRQNTNKLIKEKNIDKLKEYLLTYPKLTSTMRKKLNKKWNNTRELDEILKIYSEIVLKKTDNEINKIIKQYSTYSTGLNIVSQKAWFDFLITLYFYSKIIIEIARIYHIRIGICSFIKLMMFGLLGTSISSLIQQIATESTKHLPVINILTEAAVNGSLVYILGTRVQSVLRPIKEKI